MPTLEPQFVELIRRHLKYLKSSDPFDLIRR